MIARLKYRSQVERALKRSPICALLGPRQCGKTTLARALGLSDRTVKGYLDENIEVVGLSSLLEDARK